MKFIRFELKNVRMAFSKFRNERGEISLSVPMDSAKTIFHVGDEGEKNIKNMFNVII